MANTPDIKEIMAQAQQMQKKMQAIQENLAKTEITGESGGGFIKITMTCRYEVRKILISDEAWKESHEILEELIMAAFNDAIRKVEKISKERVTELSKEMGLPTES